MGNKYTQTLLFMDLSYFLSKIIIDKNGCWIWQGLPNHDGYGVFQKRPFNYLAHRFFYFYFYNFIDENLTIDHLCRNRKCVNPIHLEQVTARENILRGSCQSTVNQMKMECIRGHPFDFSNTYINPASGARQCRICKYEDNKRRRMKKRMVVN